MNDFTKDELITIRHSLRMAYKNSWEDEELPHPYDVHSKTCNLIDNYCEHEDIDKMVADNLQDELE